MFWDALNLLKDSRNDSKERQPVRNLFLSVQEIRYMSPGIFKASVQSRGHISKKGKIFCLIISINLANINHSVLRVINFMFIFSKSANNVIILSFYRWWSWGLKHLSNYLKAIQIVSGKAVTPTHTWVGNRFFLPYFLPKSFTKSDQDIRTLWNTVLLHWRINLLNLLKNTMN